jgi:pimeloyl-ACP methyl ester carboxylesterase
MNVYFISGLGADSRIFKFLNLPEGFEKRYVEWIAPLDGERLTDYAERLTAQMDLTEPFVVAGLSLGGIMATEIAKRHAPAATILISSIPLSRQMPKYFLWARYIGLTKVVPVSFIKKAAVAKRFLTTEKDEHKELVFQLIKDADDRFMQWAMDAVLRWKNEEIPQPLWQIHGTRDEVFPVMLTRPTHLIPKAGHMALLTDAERVDEILEEILQGVRTARAVR